MENWKKHKPKKFEFRGNWIYNWFSNTKLVKLTIDGEVYHSVENYYQSQKILSPILRKEIATVPPYESKHLTKKLKIRDDWEDIKESVMEKALRAKFTQHSFWKEKLLCHQGVIVEWNNWGDRYWGADYKTGKGKNRLGILLMKIREDLKHNNEKKK